MNAAVDAAVRRDAAGDGACMVGAQDVGELAMSVKKTPLTWRRKGYDAGGGTGCAGRGEVIAHHVSPGIDAVNFAFQNHGFARDGIVGQTGQRTRNVDGCKRPSAIEVAVLVAVGVHISTDYLATR